MAGCSDCAQVVAIRLSKGWKCEGRREQGPFPLHDRASVAVNHENDTYFEKKKLNYICRKGEYN